MLSLGPSLPLAFQLGLLPACLPASGGGWASPQLASCPLVFTQSFFSEEWAWQCPRLGFFVGYFSLSFLSLSLIIPQFGLLCHVSSLRLPSGHSGPVLTLSNAACASLFSLRLLVADASIWATSLVGVTVRHIIYGFQLFNFFLPVMLPSEIPKLPTDPLVRGFPSVWKLLLFYDSLPGTGLRP